MKFETGMLPRPSSTSTVTSQVLACRIHAGQAALAYPVAQAVQSPDDQQLGEKVSPRFRLTPKRRKRMDISPLWPRNTV